MKSLNRTSLINLVLAGTLVLIVVFGYFYLQRQAPGLLNAAVRKIKTSAVVPPTFKTHILDQGEGAMKGPMAVATDSDGNVFVVDRGNVRITVFDSDGKYIASFGKAGNGPGEFNTPFSITAAGERIYVGDLKQQRIQYFNSKGDYQGEIIGEAGESGGTGPFIPAAMAADSRGNLYVTDIIGHRVIVFGPDGRMIRQFGSAGDKEGLLSYPNGIWADSAGKIYVADSNNARVQIFDNEGNFLTKIGGEDVATGGFIHPRGIGVDPSGIIYVADTLMHQVSAFDSQGKFLFNFGQRGLDNGQFNYPNGLTIDSRGRILIADRENNRISVFGY